MTVLSQSTKKPGISLAKKNRHIPISMNPNHLLISNIQLPARGKRFKLLANVPIKISGVLRPKPKIKSKHSPNSLLPKVATIVNSNAKPGDKQGEATVPLITPKVSADSSEPALTVCARVCIKRGI